jgi:hypothetical protein
MMIEWRSSSMSGFVAVEEEGLAVRGFNLPA